MKTLIHNLDLITKRANILRCTVVALLNTTVLCHRNDNTYITWKVSIVPSIVGRPARAVFDSGDYDMDAVHGQQSLVSRSGWEH